MASFDIIFVTIVLFLVDCVDSSPVHINNHVTKSISGKDDAFAVSYLIKFGYLAPTNARLGRLRKKSELDNAIKEVQRFAGLEVTGAMNAKTLNMMKKPRCGVPDFGPTDNTRRRKRYALHGTKWKKTHLTYRIVNKPRTNEISEDQVHTKIQQAFKMWTKVSRLTFEKLAEGNADIMISFREGRHDDGYPFDGVGGTLAHGFFPHDNLGLSGDVHFDDDEKWVLGTSAGTDFFWTAVHEIGHAIGLDHSYHQSAIMYPFFLGYQENLKLGKDDILGIQVIYGKPKPTDTTTAPPPMPTLKESGPSACQTPIDAVFHGNDNNTYFFKEQHFWKLDKYNRLSGALKLKDHWPELRSRVQAAYTRPDGKTVFFKGRRFWVYEGTKYIEGPKLNTDYGLPAGLKQLDAVFVWGGNRKTYFFKGHQYWRYNEELRSLDPGYPKNITTGWGVVPQPIDSVMTWKDGVSYFFKGQTFQKYDFYNRAQHMVGENIGEYFMGCSDVEVAKRNPFNGVQRLTIFTPVLTLLSFAVTTAIF